MFLEVNDNLISIIDAGNFFLDGFNERLQVWRVVLKNGIKDTWRNCCC